MCINCSTHFDVQVSALKDGSNIWLYRLIGLQVLPACKCNKYTVLIVPYLHGMS